MNSTSFSFFRTIGVEGTMYLCFVLGISAMCLVLWTARPGRARVPAMAVMGSTVAFGFLAALFDPSSMDSPWTKYAVAVGTPFVVWCLGRECWTGYCTPWQFSWRRLGLVVLAIWAMGYLIVTAVPQNPTELVWAPYFLILLLSPLFVFKALFWWTLNTLKKVYMSTYIREKDLTRAADVYFITWWYDGVRGQKVDQAKWLTTTKQHPQFMDSFWWRNKGIVFWPDLMEWQAKMGTLGMLWFIEQRMESPPEELDDYSHAEGLWSFTGDAKTA